MYCYCWLHNVDSFVCYYVWRKWEVHCETTKLRLQLRSVVQYYESPRDSMVGPRDYKKHCMIQGHHQCHVSVSRSLAQLLFPWRRLNFITFTSAHESFRSSQHNLPRAPNGACSHAVLSPSIFCCTEYCKHSTACPRPFLAGWAQSFYTSSSFWHTPAGKNDFANTGAKWQIVIVQHE